MYDYYCEECGAEQIKWHKLKETNTEDCEKCGAKPEHLKKMLAAVKPHFSWQVRFSE